jgi:CNT family concentrative nucleoside transporter
MNMISLLRGVLGLSLILGIAILFSNNRRRISWRLVGSGILIQAVFAVFILYSDMLKSWFAPLGWPKVLISWLGGAIVSLLNFTAEGSKFVFGRLAVNSGPDSLGVYFAFQVLPTIIFVATLTSVLYYLGILQLVVKGMAKVMSKVMGTSGAESLSNTANIFVGQTEAPLLIKPYIGAMTNSEILTIMVGGMATIAGGVMAAYIQMLGQALAEVQKIPLAEAQLRFAVQLLAASVMAAPASLVIAKILYPETGTPVTKGTVKLKVEKNASNVIEAAATGAGDGLQLALNVGAMLLAFIAGISLINYLFTGLGNLLNVNAYLTANSVSRSPSSLFSG